MYKKVVFLLTLLIVITLSGCSLGSSNQILSPEEFAQKKGFSIGEFNKDYLLDHQFKHKDGSFMSINFTDLKVEEERALTDVTLQHAVVITSADSLEITKEALNDALYFEFYTAKDRKANLDIRMFLVDGANGQSEIILNCEKFDITLYDYLVVGPIEEANGQKLVFSLPKN